VRIPRAMAADSGTDSGTNSDAGTNSVAVAVVAGTAVVGVVGTRTWASWAEDGLSELEMGRFVMASWQR